MLRYLIALLIALLGCCWAALFYRPLNTYANNQLVSVLGDDFLSLRTYVQTQFPLSDVFIYNVPGALWVFGLTLLGWRLYLGSGRLHLSLFYVPLFISQFFELAQVLNWTDGTFDWLDLCWNFIGFFVGLAFCQLMPDEWRAGDGYWRYLLFFLVLCAAFGVDVLN